VIFKIIKFYMKKIAALCFRFCKKIALIFDIIEFVINDNDNLRKIKDYIIQEPIPEIRKHSITMFIVLGLVINEFEYLEELHLSVNDLLIDMGITLRFINVTLILFYFLLPIICNIVFDVFYKIFNIKKPEPYLRSD